MTQSKRGLTTSHNVDRFQKRSDSREALQLLSRLTMVDETCASRLVSARPIYAVVSVKQKRSVLQSHS